MALMLKPACLMCEITGSRAGDRQPAVASDQLLGRHPPCSGVYYTIGTGGKQIERKRVTGADRNACSS